MEESKKKNINLMPGGVRGVGKRKLTASKYNWLAIKRDYISDVSASYKSLSQKYGVTEVTISKRAHDEKWPLLREEVQRKAELSLAEDAEADVREVKKRHVRIARLMQKVGLEALENFKPKNSKEAREFLVEGIKIEKQALGIDQNKPVPAIIGIVGKEKEIIGKYETIEEGEEVKNA